MFDGLHVLVVEADVTLAQTLETCLTALGASAITVTPGIDAALEAIPALPAGAGAVALVGWRLNGAASDAVCAALAERGIPYVVQASRQPEPGESWPTDAPVLRQPYSLAELHAVMSSVVGWSATSMPRTESGRTGHAVRLRTDD